MKRRICSTGRCAVVWALAEVLFQLPRHLMFAFGIHLFDCWVAGFGLAIGFLLFLLSGQGLLQMGWHLIRSALWRLGEIGLRLRVALLVAVGPARLGRFRPVLLQSGIRSLCVTEA